MLLDWYTELDDSGDGRLTEWEFVDSAKQIATKSSCKEVQKIGSMSER